MDIIVESHVERLPDIQIGDVFVNFDEKVYQFTELDLQGFYNYALVNLGGKGTLNAYTTKEVAIENILGLIGYKGLSHFSKDEWYLKLKAKGIR